MSTPFLKPQLPESVIRWIGDTVDTVLPTGNQVVAIVGVADWGPVGIAPDSVLTKSVATSLAQWEQVYGTDDTQARRAVSGAFRGQGLAGINGAGGVIFYRIATSAAATATRVIQNTAPAAALTLTAKYKGTRGNLLSFVIEDDPLDATKDRLRLLFNGQTVEKHSYLQTDITALAAAINATSHWVVASGVTSGVALTHTAGTTLAGGNDGASVTSVEVEDAQASLEFKDFGIFCMAGLTDAAIKVQLAVWEQQMADEMRPFRLVLGGAAGESVDDVITELNAVGNEALRDEHVIRFGVGTFHDDFLDADLSTAELAPRIAGTLAARGERSALTRCVLGGLTLVGSTGATTDELVAGRDQGVTMLRQVSSADGSLAIAQGVTTYISKTAPAKPYALFSEPRIVGLLDRILRQVTQWGDEVVIGDLPVTDDTRNLVRKELLKIGDELVIAGLAEPNSFFANVDPPNDPSLADAIPFEFGFIPTRTANYLIGNGRVR